MTIAEFVDKWHNGAAKGGAGRHNGRFLGAIEDSVVYSAKDISTMLGHKRALNMNAACRAGLVDGASKVDRVWVASGSAWREWRNASGSRRFSIRKRLGQMRIRQVNEVTGAVVSAHVTNCVYSGSKTTYRVSAGNYTTVATADHRIFTDTGWVRLGDLVPGESKVMTYKYGSGVNPDKFKKIDGVWVSRWAEQVKGSVSYRQLGLCAISGDPLPISFHIHHVIPKHKRPDLAFDIDNVIAVAPDEHRKLHSTQGWQTGVPLLTEFTLVDSVDLECVQETYDLSISGEFENFFADGIVVHNSRNASSSRAIPTARLAISAIDDMCFPIIFGKNQPGMQASGETLVGDDYMEARSIWKSMAETCAAGSKRLSELGLHKQWANRILEPFQHIHVVVTATEWQNFFDLRCHKDAQPEMQALAYAMHHASQASTPQYVANGGWHLPYVSEDEKHQYGVDTLIKMSAARCARVSYLTHEGKAPNVEEDINLYNRLVNAVPPHMSPVEHQAMAVPSSKFFANFRGWKQHRWDLERNT